MVVLLLLVLAIIAIGLSKEAKDPSDYGVDHSFPIHHYLNKNDNPIAYERYNNMMQTCYKAFSQRECDSTERARLAMNRDQPAKQHNYTEIGFKKLRAPESAWKPLIDFYERNKDNKKLEVWGRGNTYVNSWETPTKMISFEDTSLRGGISVKNQIWNGVKPILEEWTGQKLMPTSLYGIRVYEEGSILSTHVDRLPLVSSCIIQVAQDVDEPWPIEVYDHAGKAYNVTMQPGDMTLYESHTVLHGRPFPLKGKFFANVFVHFKPIDHDKIQMQDREAEKAAAAERKRLANPLNRIYDALTNIGSSRDDTHKTISGHEQFQHDAEDMKEHLAHVDREIEAKRRRAAVERMQARRAAADEDDLPDASDDDSSELSESDDEKAALLPSEAKPRFASPNLNAAARDNEEGVKESEFTITEEAKQAALRIAAAKGDFQELQKQLDKSSLHHLQTKDNNDWQLLHEAVRSGQIDTVKLLVSLGADLNAKVAQGGTPLWLAKHFHESNHPVVEYLTSIGAPDYEDEL